MEPYYNIDLSKFSKFTQARLNSIFHYTFNTIQFEFTFWNEFIVAIIHTNNRQYTFHMCHVQKQPASNSNQATGKANLSLGWVFILEQVIQKQPTPIGLQISSGQIPLLSYWHRSKSHLLWSTILSFQSSHFQLEEHLFMRGELYCGWWNKDFIFLRWIYCDLHQPLYNHKLKQGCSWPVYSFGYSTNPYQQPEV